MTNTEYNRFKAMKGRVAYLFLTEAPTDKLTHTQIVNKLGPYSYKHEDWAKLAGVRRAEITGFNEGHMNAYWTRVEWRLRDPHTGDLVPYFKDLSHEGKKLYQANGCPDIGNHYYKGTNYPF